MSYKVELSRRAIKQLAQLKIGDKKTLVRIKARIDSLADNPRPEGTIKLSGEENLYRVRVGDYRILYKIQDDVLVVLVLRIMQRGGVYKP